jgi:hypothetical protein
MDFADEALELSERLKLPVQAAETRALLVRIQIARNDIASAVKLAEDLRLMPVTMDGTTLKQSLFADALIAWSSQDVSLMGLVHKHIVALDVPAVPRAEQTYYAIYLASELLSTSANGDPGSVARLRDLHEKGRSFGGQDFACSVLLEALNRSGDATTAKRLRDRYLRSARRERYPLPDRLPSLSSPSVCGIRSVDPE